MSSNVVDKLESYLASAQAITDVTQYNLYARIRDYMDYIEKEPSLQSVLDGISKDGSLHDSLDMLKKLKEVVDAPDVLLDGWEKEMGFGINEAIKFAFRHGNIKSLKKPYSHDYIKRREVDLKQDDYKGHLTNIHYALLRALKTNTDPEASKETNGDAVKEGELGIEERDYEGVLYGCLIYKGKAYKIAKPRTRQYKLLKSLFFPKLGVIKTLEAVFGDIRLPKDGPEVDSPVTGYQARITIVNNTLKEINTHLPTGRLMLDIKWFEGKRKLSMFMIE